MQRRIYNPRNIFMKSENILMLFMKKEGIHKVSTQVRGNGGRIQEKVYIYCFHDVILLLKCLQGGGGHIYGLFKWTHCMEGPIVNRLQSLIIVIKSSQASAINYCHEEFHLIYCRGPRSTTGTSTCSSRERLHLKSGLEKWMHLRVESRTPESSSFQPLIVINMDAVGC